MSDSLSPAMLSRLGQPDGRMHHLLERIATALERNVIANEALCALLVSAEPEGKDIVPADPNETID